MATGLAPFIERLLAEAPASAAGVHRVKVEVARAVGADRVPSNRDILGACAPDERAALAPILRVKRTRSLSGVAIVTVQASPEACPHGRCTFCPGGPDAGTAMSYTGHEPAARRALRHAFDPHDQAATRLRELARNGHPTDKVELIVQGGTFPARDGAYQESFVQRCFDALNGAASATLAEAHARNETAGSRCVGLTLETKPDWCLAPHVDHMLSLGTTRVEIGVQTVFDDVLHATNRGHTMTETFAATRIARDAGLKVCHHLMPGLPGSSVGRDMESARLLFEDPRLRPDMVKIYPCLVVPGTPLHTQWQRGGFTPLSTDQAADVVARIKALVPPWVRIQRVDRDIPTHQIAAGVLHTNLRQMALVRLGRPCACLRCRELARKAPGHRPARLELVERSYDAGEGREAFLAFEAPEADAVVAYLRLRSPSPHAHRPELAGAAIVRELKVTGPEVPLHDRDAGAFQHRGLGAALMGQAEERAREAGADRLLVMSAVGTREYYRRLGYVRVGPYVGKALR